jgi:hypothetical protein
MDAHPIRMTYTYTLKPPPEQAWALLFVVRRGR